jgi:ABC-type branched-subunit amino acid transport system ATPase component
MWLLSLGGDCLVNNVTYLKEPVIETSDLVKIYKEGAIKAVDGLNLKIDKGEIYALIGANGSGKTTTRVVKQETLITDKNAIIIVLRSAIL